jgi:hypothetical protein
MHRNIQIKQWIMPFKDKYLWDIMLMYQIIFGQVKLARFNKWKQENNKKNVSIFMIFANCFKLSNCHW